MEIGITFFCRDLFMEIRRDGYLHIHSVHEIIINFFLLLDLMHADLRLFKEIKEEGI